MVQPAQHWARFDLITDRNVMPMAAGRNLGLDWFRNARSERGMRTSTIVMDNVFFQNEAKVPFIYRNEVIQTLPSNRSNEPFAVGIRCGSLYRCSQNPHSEVAQRGVQRNRKDRIVVVNEKLVGMLVGENLSELLRCPFGRGMLGEHYSAAHASNRSPSLRTHTAPGRSM
jgi:hypothetical protein